MPENGLVKPKTANLQKNVLYFTSFQKTLAASGFPDSPPKCSSGAFDTEKTLAASGKSANTLV